MFKDKTKQDTTRQYKTRQYNTIQGKTRQGNTSHDAQDKYREDWVGYGKTNHDTTRQ